MAEQKSFSETLFGWLDRIEAVLLVGLAVSLVANYMNVAGAATGIVVSLCGLAGVFFLMAYRPPAPMPERQESDSKPAMPALLMQTILPKVLWLSSAIGAAGLAIYHTHPDNDGYKQLLLIQSASCVLGIVLIGLFSAQGVSGAKKLVPVLYRAVPITLAGAQLLMA